MLKTIVTKRKVPGTPGWYWLKPASEWRPARVDETLSGLSVILRSAEDGRTADTILVEDAPGVWGPEIKPPKEKQIVA